MANLGPMEILRWTVATRRKAIAVVVEAGFAGWEGGWRVVENFAKSFLKPVGCEVGRDWVMFM